MTTLFPFVPSPQSAFQFQPIFDGDTYTCTVTWNLFGQRWYVNCYDLSGTWIFTVARIGSPAGYDISLTAGYFTSTLVYREASATFEVSP